MQLFSCSRIATIAFLASVAQVGQAATFSVTTTNDSGVGSFREAISNVNATAGSHLIDFAITPLDTEVKTITLETALPTIGRPVTVNGYSQPGSSENTATNADNAVLLVQLDGNAVAPGSDGLVISGSNSLVRGLIISGFPNNGISIFGSQAVNVIIAGNFIGTGPGGTNASGNDGGVFIGGPNATIGGTTVADRNVISGNIDNGIGTGDLSNTNSVIQGNFIGVSATGTDALGNGTDGIEIFTARNLTIGGDASGAGNVIGGNGANGINVGTSGHVIMGNFIGTDLAGSASLGNTLNGILLTSATSNTLGGTTGNLIAFNGGSGIRAQNVLATNNLISVNSIYSNAGLGIDLGTTGVTTNDDCDVDSDGANKLQNFPILTLTSNAADNVVIQGTLNSNPNTEFLIEFFANTICDPSGHGEGEFFIGETNVTTGADCSNDFIVTLPVQLPDAPFITATATDPEGNTSEFSPCISNVVEIVGLACSLTPTLDTNTVDTAHTVTSTITTNAVAANGVTVNFDVTSGPNNGDTGTNTTDGAGQATFQYTGNGGVGIDVVRAVASVGGQAITCTATKVWVTDGGGTNNLPPVAECRNLTTNANANCQAVVIPAAINDGSSDPDNDPLTFSLSPAGPYDLGSNTVMLIVADDQGNTNSCSATINVVDTRPAITCAGNIVRNVAAGVTNAVVTFTAPTVNCNVVTNFCTPASGSTFPLGTNTVTCTAISETGATNTCAFTVLVQQGPVETHDLAIVKMKAPKNINLNAAEPALTQNVIVTIQNRSPHNETVTNLTGLITVVAQSLGTNCPNPVVTLHAGAPNKGKTLKPKQKMNVFFDVTYDCARDLLKGVGHEDFRFSATVNHAALDGNADSHPACDVCPRDPLGVDDTAGLNIKDKGCGSKDKDSGDLVGPTTDVFSPPGS